MYLKNETQHIKKVFTLRANLGSNLYLEHVFDNTGLTILTLIICLNKRKSLAFRARLGDHVDDGNVGDAGTASNDGDAGK